MHRMVYVMGLSHCGSTLLSFLLNSHPEILSVGEASPSYKRNKDRHLHPCSCGESIGDCEFWSSFFEKLNEKGIKSSPLNWPMHYTHNTILRNLLFQEHANWILQALKEVFLILFRAHIDKKNDVNVECIKTLLEIGGKSVLADTSKSPDRFKLLYRSKKLDIKLIWLVRDVRASVNSMRKRGFGFNYATERWKKGHEVMKKVYDSTDSKDKMILKYEELCSDYQFHMNKIFNFLGLGEFEIPTNYKASVHHIMGHKTRLEGARAIRDREEWRKNLTLEDQIKAIEKTRNIAAQLGYS